MKSTTIYEQLSGLSKKLEGELFYNESPAHQAILQAYATDASVYQERPQAVVHPKSERDLRELVAFASVYGLNLIPRAAGTSLAGQVVGHGIVVDISRYFTQILEINQEEAWVRVQPGVIRDDLNVYLRPYGLLFGPETSTASRAMIGGMIGNNSSGLHSTVWGDTRSKLLEARVLLDDGSEAVFCALSANELAEKKTLQNREGALYRDICELLDQPDNQQAIREGYPKASITRRNTGYALDLLLDDYLQHGGINLCKLLAGSEGTLGFILEAKLKLISLPEPEIGILCVHCHSILEAMHANILALDHQPESSELVDKYILDFTKGHPKYQYNRFFIEGDPEALLMVEFRATSPESLQSKGENLRAALIAADLGYAYPFITGVADTDRVWDVRKAGLGLIRNLPGDTQPVNLIEDCAVDPKDLPAYVTEVQAILTRHGLRASFYAHAGAGELHIEPLINLKSSEGLRAFRAVLSETAEVVRQFKGSLSGEHGDGRLRGEFISTVLGPEVYELLNRVKEIFDPQALFNRGKIVQTPPMDAFLRYQTDQPSKSISVIFDYSKQESILRLAEKCSGSGDCRKTHLSGGTMCPSYMGTREEKDTTRARANLLRHFLTNSTQKNVFAHEELKEIMDLCLSCKACKTECPSGVDMAKMKTEFLQHYYDAKGVPVRSWIIAHFSDSQRLATLAPRIYNTLIQTRWTSNLIKDLLGFARDRSLPKVGKTTLNKWVRRERKRRERNGDARSMHKRVYLFIDEFTNYNDLEIGQTAYRLLQKLGYEVLPAPVGESGRALLSKGLLRRAQKIANSNVEALKHLISAETPLVGIEPSAIITFRDEYPELVHQDLRPAAYELAQHALSIEEFLSAEMDAGRIRPDQFNQTAGQAIKLHGHCYQKAFHLVDTLVKVLSFPPGNRVEVIPSGCCGMAGSFGYEKEHFELSRKIGELVLLPAVRKTPEEVLIAAPGTSCRHQIKDGTQRIAFHPVEILYRSLRF